VTSYTDDFVKRNIDECDSFIQIKYRDSVLKIQGDNEINNKKFISSISNDEVFQVALYCAWLDFYSKFRNDSTLLDKNTIFNRNKLGDRVLFSADQVKDDPVLFLSNLLRVIIEASFWEGTPGLFYSRDDVLTVLANSYSRREYQFEWIRDSLQISVVQFLLHSDAFKMALQLGSNITEQSNTIRNELNKDVGILIGTLNSEKESIKKDFDTKKEEVSALLNDKEEELSNILEEINSNVKGIDEVRERLSSYHSEFNFVGLYAGFKELKKSKDEELDSAKGYYHLAMIIAILLPLLSIGAHILFPQLVNGKTLIEWVSWAAPFAAVELLILYYARVIYSEVKSLRTQLVQINLRGALCQFIEEYMNYRKKMKNEKGELNDAALDKFDSLIFSTIQMDSDNIPGALDGVNAIAELAGKLLAKSKP
jgi:molecular chaperone GrpE (heat shock protein)